MKHVFRWTVSLVVVCMVAIPATVESRKVVSMPTVKSVEEALQYIDAFKGDADNCRVGIPEQLFDPAGVSAARITDRALSRGWEPDGFIRVLDYRVYRFRAIGSQPNKAVAADRADKPRSG